MEDDNINQWLQQAREAGLGDEEIRRRLKSSGWNNEQIRNLMSGNFQDGLGNSVSRRINQRPEQIVVSGKGKIIGVSSLLAATWKIIKKRIFDFIVINLLSILSAGLLFAAISAVGWLLITAFTAIFSAISLSRSILPTIYFFIGYIGGVGIYFVSLSALMAYWTPAYIMTVYTSQQPNFGLKKIFVSSWRYVKQYFWLSVLVNFISSGIYLFIAFVSILVIILTQGRSVMLGKFSLFSGTGILTLILLAGALVVFIIINVWMSLSFFFPIAENIFGFGAILRSREYIRGKWWPVFSRQIIPLLVIFFPYLISVIFLLTGQGNKNAFLPGIVSLIYIAVIFIGIPFVLSYNFVIYRSLSSVKSEAALIPKKGTKIGLLVVSIAGWVFFLAIPFIIIGLVKTLGNYF